jgi:uncharacterized protein (DUF302 family)
MPTKSDNGIMTLQSDHAVEQTVKRIQETLLAKGTKLFAVIDHSGEAEAAGMLMPPTKLLIFGNPKAGTPLMIAAPSIAIDLPLKLLVWADSNRKVWIAYNDPDYLKVRHNLPADLVQNLAAAAGLAETAK